MLNLTEFTLLCCSQGKVRKEMDHMVVMQITHQIQPEYVEHYIKVTRANAQATQQEAGNIRFDLLQDSTDPCCFLLYEVYVDREAQQAHLASEHFAIWKEAVQGIFTDRSFRKLEAIHVP